MAPGTKTPEDWITFLLTLIDYTPNFKPSWEEFASDTGMYKKGKFVNQAYRGLRDKYPSLKEGAPGKANEAGFVAPATPKKVVAAAASTSTPKKAATTPSSNKKRKAPIKQGVNESGESDEDDDEGSKKKKVRRSPVKKKAEVKVEDGDDTDGDESADGEDREDDRELTVFE